MIKTAIKRANEILSRYSDRFGIILISVVGLNALAIICGAVIQTLDTRAIIRNERKIVKTLSILLERVR